MVCLLRHDWSVCVPNAAGAAGQHFRPCSCHHHGHGPFPAVLRCIQVHLSTVQDRVQSQSSAVRWCHAYRAIVSIASLIVCVCVRTRCCRYTEDELHALQINPDTSIPDHLRQRLRSASLGDASTASGFTGRRRSSSDARGCCGCLRWHMLGRYQCAVSCICVCLSALTPREPAVVPSFVLGQAGASTARGSVIGSDVSALCTATRCCRRPPST